MNEAELKDMVFQLLKTKDASEEGEEEEEELDAHEQQQFSAHQQPSCSSSQPGPSHASSSGRQLRSQAHQFGANIQRRQQIIVGEQQQPSTSSAPQQQQQQPLDEDWVVAEVGLGILTEFIVPIIDCETPFRESCSPKTCWTARREH